MKVSFVPLLWEDYPSINTPINAENLNRLEAGVAGLYEDMVEINARLNGAFSEYVTDWLDEHVTPTGSAVIVDDSLTIEGAAADAKKTGDEISDLKENLNIVHETVFDDDALYVNSSVNNYRLNGEDGLCSPNANYKLIKYKVSYGQTLKIVSNDRFQFQNAPSVPTTGNNNRIGTTYKNGVYLVEVPEGATDLVLSSPISGDDYAVYIAVDRTITIESDIKQITKHNKIDFTKRGYIALSTYSVGDTVDLTPLSPSITPSAAAYSWAVEECEYTDSVFITGTGGGSPRLWAFVDEDNALLLRSNAGTTITEGLIPVPRNAAKVIINSETNALGDCFVVSKTISDFNKITGCEIIPSYLENCYIKTGGVTSVDIGSITNSVGYKCTVIDCEQGDVFSVTGASGSNPRLWCFIDENGNVLSVDEYSSNYEKDKIIIAPEGSAMLICNFNCAEQIDEDIGDTFTYDNKLNTNYPIITVNDFNPSFGFGAGNDNYEIFDCGKTWLNHNDDIQYGTAYVPNCINRVNGINTFVTSPIIPTGLTKYPLDCASFVQMCLRGVGYEESIFGDRTNRIMYSHAPIDWLSDNLLRFITHRSNGRIIDFPDTIDWERTTTNQFAEWLHTIGLYHELTNRDQCLGLKVGDVLFFGSKNKNYSRKRFNGIYHCGIVAGVGNGANIYNDNLPCDVLVLECVGTKGDDNPIRVRWRSYADDNICGYARIPSGGRTYSKHEKVAEKDLGNVSEWDTYKVTLRATYTDNDMSTVFPAIFIEGNATPYAALDYNTMPHFENGVETTFDIYVCFANDISPIITGRMVAGFTAQTSATIAIDSAIKII